MKLCEFYRNQFEEAKSRKYFNADNDYLANMFGQGSYKWFKGMAANYFGGGYLKSYTAAGITTQQLREAKEQGFIKHHYYSNWQARQLNQTDWYGLTEKGLKALYKAYSWQ